MTTTRVSVIRLATAGNHNARARARRDAAAEDFASDAIGPATLTCRELVTLSGRPAHKRQKSETNSARSQYYKPRYQRAHRISQRCEMDSDTEAVRRRLEMVTQTANLDAAGREARLQAGVRAYENARSDGLCHEGAWECALEAVQGSMTRARSSHE